MSSSLHRKILVTGGAGFIGSHLLKHFSAAYPSYEIFVVDALTYAGKLENIAALIDQKKISFFKQDIVDSAGLFALMERIKPHWVMHLAAESHVDRSIQNATDFVYTNVIGTVNLLTAFKRLYDEGIHAKEEMLFYHCSTDEVYGTLALEEKERYFTEQTPYDPRSPYAASKASSDHFVRAFFHTYRLPVLLSNCSNNYGTHQHPEKFIPVIVRSCVQEQPIPVYGNGQNVRDWIHVSDHVKAIDKIVHHPHRGQTFNVGAMCECSNLHLVKKICGIVDELCQKKQASERLISFVEDRLGHDVRYAIDPRKAVEQLGWKSEMNFDEGLRHTVAWYVQQFL